MNARLKEGGGGGRDGEFPSQDSDVMAKTKISRIDRLLYFLTHGAPCALLRRAELRDDCSEISDASHMLFAVDL